jgi:hypothetical protein
MKGSKALLVTLAMTAGMLALVFGLRGQYGRLAAEHWRGQLDAVPDEDAGILLRAVAELGEPGIPVLVEALGSERESIARAGKQALSEQLERWQMLSPSAASSRLAILADALAERVERFGPPARHDAANLATRILLWPLDSRAADARRVIASCEKVFQATSVPGGVLLEDGLAGRRHQPVGPADADPGRHQPATADDPTELGRSLVSLSRFPGGGLPIESFPKPAEPQDAEPILVGDGRSGGPRRLAPPPAARPLSTWRQPDGTSAAAGRPAPVPASQAPSDRPPPDPNPLRKLSLTGEDGALSSGPSDKFSELETVQLMQRLARQEEPRASGARAELVRRGFTEVHLELARRLFDPDPEVRKRLARLLPAVQSVDAAPWLLWLSRDSDPEVRLVAIGLIATSGDAVLLEQIEQAAREDPDPQIQRQAELIAARRNRERR